MDDPRRQRPFGAEGAGSAPDAEHLFRELRDVFAQSGERTEPGAGIPHECLDFCPICRTADVLRATTPPEVREHWHGLQRELALLLRSALDAYLERSETRRAQAAQVEDIPIE